MKIYLVINDNPKWIAHDILYDLGSFLSKKYKSPFIIQKGGFLYIDSLNLNIGDVEIVIFDEEKNILKAFSFSENMSELWKTFKERNNHKDILIILNPLSWGLDEKQIQEVNFTVKRNTFYAFTSTCNYDYFYEKRSQMKKCDIMDKIFFKTVTGRGGIELFDNGFLSSIAKVNHDTYIKEAIKYKVGLSIAGVAEWSHRDMEYMAIGLPMLRLEYIDTYSPKIIPNFHYISVDRGKFPEDHSLDRVGGKEYVKKYQEKFLEIKENFDFLNFISKNAREYYIKNCKKNIAVDNLLKRLNL